MILDQANVLWNRATGSDCVHMGLACDTRYASARPGQFVMVRAATATDPLLRRPFSIHQCGEGADGRITVELLYRVVGKGTRLLATYREGDQIDIFGPLGKGYTVSRDHERIYVVAGGIGVAPMPFLIRTLKKRRGDLDGVSVFLGGRSEDDLLCREFFESRQIPLTVTTDDGTAGDQCFITHPFEMAVQEDKPDMVYACGPIDMLQCILDFAEVHSVRCEISIETAMACGMGVCLGCAVKRRGSDPGYLHACRDGPVFDVRKIVF